MKQKKIKKLNDDITLYKESIQKIIQTFSFTCDDMLKTYREVGMDEKEIEEMSGNIIKNFSNLDYKMAFDLVKKVLLVIIIMY